MDYAGLGNRRGFSVNRPLTDEERADRYRHQTTRNAPPMDFLSVIKLNNSYIELVDRWYPVKGFAVWLGGAALLMALAMEAAIGWAFFFAPADATERWALLLILTPMMAALAAVGVFGIRIEAFRWTHYPIRLNRKTRQVYVFRQDGTVLTVPWDELFITLGTARAPLTDTTYDLRAHVLDADGKTVRESFTLGYPSLLGNAESIDKFWAFLQPYMEAPDGVERTHCHLKEVGFLAPLDSRKEGWRWSIARSFMLAAHWPWLQFLGSPFLGLNAVGRMFAMATSKQPVWPAEIEAANMIEADDPYQLTWRDNARLGWWELWYPLICTVLGVGAFVGVIVAMFLTTAD